MEPVILWLKTSLPGIIILGVACSLIAAGLIDIVTRRIPRMLRKQKSYFLSHNEHGALRAIGGRFKVSYNTDPSWKP